jgi:hypothetical protein
VKGSIWMRRVAAALGVAVASVMSAHAHGDETGSTPQSLAQRQHLLVRGEASLAAGDVDGARRAFEQAANMAHSADIELGILRTQMQAGEYRQALAFAAHTAGVHLDDVEGAAFYAWLLNLGAQVAVGEQTLRAAEHLAPEHPLLRELRARWQSGELIPGDVMRQLPARLAPYATGATALPAASVQGSAILLPDGQHALAPRAALTPGATLWLRNGLGHTVAATISEAPHGDASELVLLNLAQTLPTPGGEIVPPRDAFPGSQAFAMNFSLDTTGQPAWPVMRAGFLGMPLPGAIAWRRLGVGLPGQGVRGGPVYDQGGRLIGVALGLAQQADRLVPISDLRQRFGDRFGAQTPESHAASVGADELYERALKTTLQVLTTGPGPLN